MMNLNVKPQLLCVLVKNNVAASTMINDGTTIEENVEKVETTANDEGERRRNRC